MITNNSSYARQLNNIFFRVGATEEAKRQMIPENMEKMKKEFQFVLPYVQGVLLQSVIYLTDEEFSAIEEDYRELIAQAQSSDDEWVKIISSKFENYPKLSSGISQVGLNEEYDQYDYSGLTPLVVNNSNIENMIPPSQDELARINTNRNYKINSVEPPSKSFQLKSLADIQKDKISTSHFYSAPPKRIMQPLPTTPKPAQVSLPPNLPPREKKEKIIHSIDELKSNYFPNKDTKKKTQLTLFHAFNS